jgi:ankyrin repeat protein
MWYFYGSDSSHYGQHLTNLTSLSVTVRSFAQHVDETIFIREIMSNNPTLSHLTIISNSPSFTETAFSTLPGLGQLTELNLYRVFLTDDDFERTVDILGRSNHLRTLRNVHSLGNRFLWRPNLPLARSDALLARLVSSLTQLTTLFIVTHDATLKSPNVSFTALTKLTQLVTHWKDFGSRDIDSQEPASLLSSLRAVYPPQLQDASSLLIWNENVFPNPFLFQSPLHAAAAHSSKMERWLQQWPLSIDVEDAQGKTPLMHAAVNIPRNAKTLIAAGANIFHRAHGWHGRHSIFVAAQNSDVLPLFLPRLAAALKAGSDPSIALDAIGCTPLMVAFQSEAIQLLYDCAELSAAFPPHTTKSFNGWTALQWQASLNWYTIDKKSPLLLKGCWNKDHRDHRGRSILWTCGDAASATALMAHIKTRADLAALWKRDSRSSLSATTLLMRMVRLCGLMDSQLPGFERQIDRLLGLCSLEEINALDIKGRSALSRAFKQSRAFAEFLLKRSHNARVNISAGAPLLSAITRHADSPGAVQLLFLQSGSDPNCCDRRGANALNVLMRHYFLIACVDFSMSICGDVIKVLLDAGTDPLKPDDFDGFVALHWLCRLATKAFPWGKPDFGPWDRLIRASAPVFLLPSKRGVRPVDFLFADMDSLVENAFARHVVSQMVTAGLEIQSVVSIDGSSKKIEEIMNHLKFT